MSENFDPTGGVEAGAPVCIHTNQIVDSCFDKDCVEALRVYLTVSSQTALESASGVKVRSAELLFANVAVEPLAYKRGHYAIDLTFYYRVLGDATVSGVRPTTVVGLAIFAKRTVLYGSKSKAKVFRSGEEIPVCDELLNMTLPQAVVEALDPMVLASKVTAVTEGGSSETEVVDIPANIADCFGEELALSGETKRLYVTIGQFSTVRLEREAQLSIPACEYCAPKRECCDEECCEEDPCELFSRIDFPMRAFFPSGKGEGCKEPSCGCQNCSC